jgi:hypothetical protein
VLLVVVNCLRRHFIAILSRKFQLFCLLGGAGTGGMLSFSALDANGKTILQRLPDIVPINEAQVVRKFLLENGLAPSPELSTRTVREVVALLTEKFLCVHTWELCGDGQIDMHGADVGPPGSTLATHSASGEIYMFEQCTLRVAKATKETLARRPEVVEGSATTSQEPTTTIPEGTPPSPASPVAARADDVDAWLEGAGLGKYADAIKEYGYDTIAALQVATEEDIVEMSEDSDVGMKKPHRRLLVWKWHELTA